jgi:hypothetical protein
MLCASGGAAAAADSVNASQGDRRNARALTDLDAAGCRKLWRLDEIRYEKARRIVREHYLKFRRAPHHMGTWFDAFEPIYNCGSRERIGAGGKYTAFGDGPKFMCGVDQLAESPCLVYNIGSNNVVSFEQAIRDRTGDHCEIHTFDPTLWRPYIAPHLSTFHDIGFTGNYSGASSLGMPPKWRAKLRTIQEVLRELGHVGRRIDVFKVDCEGCEWDAMQLVFDEIAAKRMTVGQLLIEVHTKPKGLVDYAQGILRFFERADDVGLRVFSKERNGWGCGGQFCVEYSFVDELQACRAFVADHCLSVARSHEVCAPRKVKRAIRKRVKTGFTTPPDPR